MKILLIGLGSTLVGVTYYIMDAPTQLKGIGIIGLLIALLGASMDDKKDDKATS